jgi:hypothetical protein
MSGNAWRAFPFQHQVTRNTVLKFDFELRAKAEGHAICLDEDTNEDVELGGNLRCFVVGGTQTDLWADVYHLQETTQGHKASYVVNIGAAKSVGSRAYINSGTQINYLAFIQDNDREPEVGESVFSNIQIYEDTPVSLKHAKSVNCHAVFTTVRFWFSNVIVSFVCPRRRIRVLPQNSVSEEQLYNKNSMLAALVMLVISWPVKRSL